MNQLFQSLKVDVLFAFRQFARQRRFWSAIIVTLVVGTAASTSMFAVVDAVLLKPLPYPNPERLVRLNTSSLRGEYFHLRDEAKTMQVAAYYPAAPEVTVSVAGEPLRLPAAGVTSDLFDVLGVRPQLGRGFTEYEMHVGSPGVVGGTYWRTYGVVILSASAWQTYFASSPAAIGSTLSIDGLPHTVVGVMPAGFSFPTPGTAFWFPHNIDTSTPAKLWAGNVARIIGRVRDGYTIEQARQELRALVPRYRELIPWGATLASYGSDVDVRSLTDEIIGGARPALLVLLASIGVVLLVVCVNVANLLLARGASRDRELATRAALGGARARLVRQLLVENVTVSLLSSALGTLLSFVSLRLLVALLPNDLPRIAEIQMDGRVVLFALGVSLLIGLTFGLLPAIRATAPGHRSLAGGTRGAGVEAREGRLTSALAAVEFSLAVVLVVAATLLIRTLWNLTAVDPGFRAEQLVAARVAPPGFEDASAATKMQFAADLLERVRAAPGMESVGLANGVPFDVGLFGNVFEIEDKDRQSAATNYAETFLGISPNYLETLETPLIEGRAFTAADRAGSTRVAIVSKTLARLNWGDESPLEKRIRFQDNRQPREGDVIFPWFTIVGVADDVKFGGLGSKTGPMLYIPLEQHWDVTSLRVVIRSREDPESVAAALRRVVSSLDGNTPVSDFRTFEARVRDTIARPRFTAYLLGSFAGIAIFLAAIGVYGVLSYAMSRRVHEIGVRMALGAGDREMFRLLFRQGLRLTSIGIAIGIPLALGATQLLSSLLYGVHAFDFRVLAGVAVALLAVGLVASYLPAHRAARIDPMQALRQE